MERNKLFMAVFIAFIMIASTAGFIMNYSVSERTTKYKNFVIKVSDKGVFAKTVYGEIRFDSFPESVEEISFNSEAVSRIKTTKMIYLSSAYNSTYSEAIGQAEYGIINELNKLDIYSEVSFTEEKDITKRISCDDATRFVPVIFFTEGETGIFLQNNCIIMSANSATDFLRVKDRLLYSVFGIME